MKSLLKQPLVHFLLAGLALFLVYRGVRARDAAEPGRIVVNREALLAYMQFQAQTSEREPFERTLNTMGATNLQHLVEAYLRDEVLYRQALRLGLDQNDPEIRRRLVMKAELTTAAEAERGLQLTDEDVEHYYEQHRAEYYDPPRFTFSQVFFDDRHYGREGALRVANEKLEALNAAHVSSADGPGQGDPYPRSVTYGRRSPAYIRTHFGNQLADALAELTPDSTRWCGPYRSRLGAHLVMLTAREEGRSPPLEEIRRWVKGDARRARAVELKEEAIRKLIDSYDVRVVVAPSDEP